MKKFFKPTSIKIKITLTLSTITLICMWLFSLSFRCLDFSAFNSGYPAEYVNTLPYYWDMIWPFLITLCSPAGIGGPIPNFAFVIELARAGFGLLFVILLYLTSCYIEKMYINKKKNKKIT